MLNLGPNPLSLSRLNFLASPPWKVEPGEEVFDWVWNPGHHLLRHRNPSKIEYDRSPKPHQTPTTNSKHAPNIENPHILKLEIVSLLHKKDNNSSEWSICQTNLLGSNSWTNWSFRPPVPKSGLLQFPISRERFLRNYIDKTPKEMKSKKTH